MTRPPRRLAATAIAFAAMAMAVAGCSSSGSGTAATSTPPTTAATTVTQTATPSTSAPASTPATTAASTSASASASSDHCTNSQLAISARTLGGASGHGGYVLAFRNVSSRACTLHGYPGVDAVRSASPAVHATRVVQGYMGGSRRGIPTVHLRSGGTGSAVLEYATTHGAGGEACPTAPRIAVTAANTTRSVTLNVSVTTCSLEIHPTVSGSSGDDD